MTEEHEGGKPEKLSSRLDELEERLRRLEAKIDALKAPSPEEARPRPKQPAEAPLAEAEQETAEQKEKEKREKKPVEKEGEVAAAEAQQAEPPRKIDLPLQKKADLLERLLGQRERPEERKKEPAPAEGAKHPQAEPKPEEKAAPVPQPSKEPSDRMSRLSALLARREDSDEASADSVPSRRFFSEGWEVRLATVWLPRIGGVLLLLGFGFGATLITPKIGPAGRVALSYGGAAVLFAVGSFVLRRSEIVGRATMTIGAAVAFFTSFAGHFLPPMQAFGVWPSLLLMTLFAAAIVAMAELWRSEATAALGFLLIALAALVSARTSDIFALVAMGFVAVGAGVVLVRHEWRRLTAGALVVVYAANPWLWFWIPIGQEQNEVLTHLGSLFLYNAVFTLAFWQWGRRWVARELLAERAIREEPIPTFAAEVLPFNHGFAMVNSLGLCGLALYLFWHTQIFWSEIHVLLYTLAATEGLRVTVPALRRGPLQGFHLTMALGLLTAGLVATYGGMTETTILAVESLVLAFVATRAPSLRLFAFFSTLVAGLTVFSYLRTYYGFGMMPGFIGPLYLTLIPGMIVLLSSLPFELVGPVRHLGKGSSAGRLWIRIGEQMRALIGAGLIIHALMESTLAHREETIYLFALAGALILGVILLEARGWWMAAGIAAFVALSRLTTSDEDLTIFYAPLFVLLYLWQEAGRRPLSDVARGWLAFMWLGIGFGFLIFTYDQGRLVGGTTVALFILAVALGAFVIGRLLPPLGRLPALLTRSAAEQSEHAERSEFFDFKLGGYRWRLGDMLGTATAGLAVATALIEDAPQSLLSVYVIAGALAAVWVAAVWRGRATELLESGLTVTAMLMLSLGFLIHERFAAYSLVPATTVPLVGMAIGVFFRRGPLALGATMLMCGAGALGIAMLATQPAGQPPSVNFYGDPWLLFGFLMIASEILLERGRRRLAGRAEAVKFLMFASKKVSLWLAGAGVGVLVYVILFGNFVDPRYVTLYWGVLGGAVLALGIVLLDDTLRYVAFAVLGLAVLRILVVDMSGLDAMARTLALGGLGLILIAAGIVYGLARKRLERKPPRD